jgi:Zn-dependent protease
MSWRDRSWNQDGTEGGTSFRQNPLSWAPKIGTLFGIRIQIHILFIIYIAVELLRAAIDGYFWWQFEYVAILFGIVFLHEMGHCFGARRVGGGASQILMWPLGGLAYVDVPRRPGASFFVAFAGPLVNIILCVITAAVLIVATGNIHAVSLNPFEHHVPRSVAVAILAGNPLLNPLYIAFKIFHVSYILLLFNFLPIFPLDGGQMFQALAWYRLGYRRAMLLATTVGMAGAAILGCFGLYRGDFLLISVAVFAYMTAMQHRRIVSMSPDINDDYDLSAASWTEPRHTPVRNGAWAKRQRQLAEEQAEVDRILEKIHTDGINSLTRKEKKTLSQATRHQREREEELGRTDRV